MPSLNRDALGKTYGPYELEVSAHESIYYALATDDPNPHYVDGLTQGGLVAPPMFAVTYASKALAALFADGQLGEGFYDYLVHGEQDMEWLSLPQPGARLETSLTIKDIQDKGSGELIIASLVTCEAGTREEVCRQEMRFFVRGYGSMQKQPSQPKPPPADRSEAAFFAEQAVAPGQTFIYAEPSGDHNPIHIDQSFAQKVGLGGIILQGLCTMAFCHKAIVQQVCEGDPHRLRRLAVRFSKPVRPGDLLTIEGWWTAPQGDTSGRSLGFEARTQSGDVVIKQGEAQLL